MTTQVEPEELEEELELDPIIAFLIKEREVRGWTQIEMGRRLGYGSGQSVWQWESGRVVPGLTSLRAWAGALDLEIALRRPVKRGRPRTNFR